MDKQITNVKNKKIKPSYSDSDCKLVNLNTLVSDPDDDLREIARELRREDRKRYEESGNWWFR